MTVSNAKLVFRKMQIKITVRCRDLRTAKTKQNQQFQMLIRIHRSEPFRLSGMQDGTATLESSWAVSYEVKHEFIK